MDAKEFAHFSQIHSPYLERILKIFSEGEYKNEILRAKKEFFERTGVTHEEDFHFESRISIFLDWYLFDRPLINVDLPPVKYFYHQYANDLSPEEKDIFADFCKSIHSVFLCRKVKNRDVHVKDLFDNKKYTVKNTAFSAGFEKGYIFEGRLIPFKGGYVFGDGFCFHPPSMKKYLLGEIKKIRNLPKSQHVKLILKLARMKLTHEYYKHVDVKHIYCNDSKF